MPGNLKTKQNRQSYNNAIRELNKSNVKYNEYLLYKIRVEMQVGGKLSYLDEWLRARENSK